ncbi:putative acetyltransferase [Mariniradius saccharolyticus AK6]|uniref:Acetyltransferase n=1 Tax=Mariniradius saccharolyticus AK6 TaxID=1239962 RepID=M7X5B6_9BACT|nr:GNAT family N-acetyltransferase [Mariniradius saccharolyticus]EMS32655.1 putative acetyltransferase [Mariniradius saccharolyticus AK6]
MIEIIPATVDLLPEVKSIAYKTWPSTFSKILTKEQIDYMLEAMYDLPILESLVLEKGHQYILAKDETGYLGFCSFEHDSNQSNKTKIHRIYLLPETQGKGLGRLLINYVVDQAKRKNQAAIYLNVNKFNEKAIQFYERIGMRKAKEEVIDIGNGFVMDDFVMEMDL